MHITHQQNTKCKIYLVYYFCTALVGSCISVCAGSRPCRPTLFWTLDGQRWPAETDGKTHHILTVLRDTLKIKGMSCLLLKYSLIPFYSLCVTIMMMVRLQPSSCVMCVETCALTVTAFFICTAAHAPTRDRYTPNLQDKEEHP